MPSYIILTRLTKTGIELIEESLNRTEGAIAMIESLGGEVGKFFIVMGQYDGVLIADFPDDETATLAVLTLGKPGNVTTETMKALDLDSFREVVAGIDAANS